MNADAGQKEYTFDVKLFANVSVKAKTRAEANAKVRELLDGASANFGAYEDGSPVLADVVLDTEDGPELVEIDGEAV